MTSDPFLQQVALLGEIDSTLGRMIDNGLQRRDVYTAFAQTRSNVAADLPGMPNDASSERAAQSNTAQADEMIADQTAARAQSDPEFAAAACDCAPDEPCCLHHSKGIILRAYARLRFGTEARTGSTDPPAGQADTTPIETELRTTDAFGVQTDAGGHDREATLLHLNGDPEDWQKVQ